MRFSAKSITKTISALTGTHLSLGGEKHVVKCLAQGHKCHRTESPELQFGALIRSTTTPCNNYFYFLFHGVLNLCHLLVSNSILWSLRECITSASTSASWRWDHIWAGLTSLSRRPSKAEATPAAGGIGEGARWSGWHPASRGPRVGKYTFFVLRVSGSKPRFRIGYKCIHIYNKCKCMEKRCYGFKRLCSGMSGPQFLKAVKQKILLGAPPCFLWHLQQ